MALGADDSGNLLWAPNIRIKQPAPEAELPDADGEAEDSDSEGVNAVGEQQVVLESRPLGLEICSATPAGKGAILAQCQGQAAAAGVEPGAELRCINERAVYDLPTTEIQGCLDEVPLPVTLNFKPPMNLPSAKKMKSRQKDPVTVCTAHCRTSYRVVQAALGQLGWKEVVAETKEASVTWLEHSDPTEGFAPAQTVTRIDAFIHMCRKAPLARCLNLWTEELPEEFNFVPQTWVLPYDAAELEASMGKGKGTFIAKPSAGTQGKGIMLAKKWGDMQDIVQKSKALGDSSGQKQSPTEHVVQQYIAQPLLLDGLKFDLRIYVIITSVVPLRAYLFKEGLARFCTVPYQAPKESNLQEACMHLTNYALNKKSSEFQQSDGEEGSKRSVSSVFWQIEQSHGVTRADLWGRVAELTASTLMALRPRLLEYYVQKRSRSLHPLAPKAFQIVGLDVLLDSKLQPLLLELNANPSLSIMQPSKTAEPQAAEESSCGYAPPVPPPDAGRLPPAGSGMQAVRSVHGDSPAVSKEPCSGSRDEIIRRIGKKLSQVATTDLAGIESLVDSLLASPAGSSSCAPAPDSEPGASSSTSTTRSRRTSREDSSSCSTAATVSSSARDRSGSLAAQSKQRLGKTKNGRSANGPTEGGGSKKFTTSQLDLDIKRELVAQALLLSRPAPQSKVFRLRKQWNNRQSNPDENIPLDDEGAWVRPDAPEELRPEVRTDAPERCPAVEALDFQDLAIPELSEYARAHFFLYRCWLRSCGPNQDTLGQAQMLKLLERRGLIGAGELFADKVATQLWLTRTWRTATEGAFGLDLPQFVQVAGTIGQMLLAGGSSAATGTGSTATGESAPGSDSDRASIRGVLEFVRRGGSSLD